MKKNKSLVFPVVFFVGILAAACTGGPFPEQGETQGLLKLRKTTVSVLLHPELISGSPRMNFTLNLLEIPEPGALEELLAALLYQGEGIDAYITSLINRYRNAYLNTRSPGGEYPDMPYHASEWEYTESMDFWTVQNRWITIRRDIDYYTGGAHGTSQKFHYVLDREELKVLAWEDLFINPEGPELYALILDGLREFAGLEKEALLSAGIFFENEPDLSPDFFLTPEGFGFHWNPYEIGPYSAGHIEVRIPWEKLEGLLNEYGRKIAAAFEGPPRD